MDSEEGIRKPEVEAAGLSGIQLCSSSLRGGGGEQ